MGDMIVHVIIMEHVMQLLGSALVLMNHLLEIIAALVLMKDSPGSIVPDLLMVSKYKRGMLNPFVMGKVFHFENYIFRVQMH